MQQVERLAEAGAADLRVRAWLGTGAGLGLGLGSGLRLGLGLGLGLGLRLGLGSGLGLASVLAILSQGKLRKAGGVGAQRGDALRPKTCAVIGAQARAW